MAKHDSSGNSVITDLNNLGVTEECNKGEAKST